MGGQDEWRVVRGWGGGGGVRGVLKKLLKRCVCVVGVGWARIDCGA